MYCHRALESVDLVFILSDRLSSYGHKKLFIGWSECLTTPVTLVNMEVIGKNQVILNFFQAV